MANFSSIIKDWTKKTQEKQTAVYRRSVELLGEEMTNTKPNGGNVPFLTGALARSLLASTQGMPKNSDKIPAGSNVGLVASGLNLNQTVWLGYQAKYARRQNYGYVGADSLGRVYNQQGSYFVEKAIAKWPQLVKKAVDEIK